MTLVLELPPEIELKVREVASAEGLDVMAFLREMTEAGLRHYDPARPLTEVDLLARINRSGFSEAFWEHFRALAAKREAGTLTPEEHKELLWHTEQTEYRNAERLPYLFQLAALRGMTVQALMTQLRLHPVPFD